MKGSDQEPTIHRRWTCLIGCGGNSQLILESCVVIVGLLGQLSDSEMAASRTSSLVPVVFGLLLAAAITLRFRKALTRTPLASATILASDVGKVARDLSCKVYILLYGLFGMKQIILWSGFSWRGATASFERPAAPMQDAFRVYFVCGLLGIAIIRILVVRQIALGRRQVRSIAGIERFP